jgi:hypothetical protein
VIQNNPFTSSLFISVWCKNFNINLTPYNFNLFKGLHFFKSKGGLFINAGKNLTKGITYEITETLGSNFKNEVCLIYDVPTYAQAKTTIIPKNLALKKIKQYPGFLIHLNHYSDIDDYLKKTFSKSSIQKLRRYNNRLQTCFNITDKMLTGASVEKTEYETVFDHFHKLLTKRFEDKQITNNNLNPKEWRFYKDVAYQLILENKAALHVIYNDNLPISVRLLYFSEHIIFDAITVFDIDYTKFHLGKISVLKMLEWSFNSKYEIFDFSKGYFDYKESWSDLKYDFEYHICYNTKSMRAALLASTIALTYKIKQYLRDKNINEKLHKITFTLKQHSKSNPLKIEILPHDKGEINKYDLQEIALNDEIVYLKKYIVDFQFLNSEHQKNIRLYQTTNQNHRLYLIKGKHNYQLLSVNH